MKTFKRLSSRANPILSSFFCKNNICLVVRMSSHLLRVPRTATTTTMPKHKSLSIMSWMISLLCLLLLASFTCDAATFETTNTNNVAVGRGDELNSDAASVVIAGGRVEVCTQCRINDLPEVKQFITDIVPLYPSLTLEDIPGAEPVIRYLDAHGDVVRSVLIATLSSDEIVENLAEHGLFSWTPMRRYIPRNIEPTSHCVAWRQTGDCKGGVDAPREEHFDELCTVRITFDRSGYCECSATRNVPLACDHDEGSCDQYCAATI